MKRDTKTEVSTIELAYESSGSVLMDSTKFTENMTGHENMGRDTKPDTKRVMEAKEK